MQGQSVYAGLTLQQKFYRIISFVQMTGIIVNHNFHVALFSLLIIN